MGPNPGQFEEIVARLVLGGEPVASLLMLSDHAALLAVRDGGYAAVFRHGAGFEAELEAQLRAAVARLRIGKLSLVVVGGGAPIQQIMQKVPPFFSINRQVLLIHLDDEGNPWAGSRTAERGLLFQALKSQAPNRMGSPSADLRMLLQAAVNPQADRSPELMAFIGRMRGIRPWATFVFLGTCVVMFILQSFWGPSDYFPSLIRMGANSPAHVTAGEVYRLGSSIFLHGDITHLLVNMFVLFYLGGFVERLLGARRFLLLLGLSGIAGSAASAWVSGAGVSVGASGALWGLLGASAALSIRPRGLVPPMVVVQLKRATLINLAVNLAVSMLPRVDVSAHLGGGVMGALLVGSGLLTLGLRSGAPSRASGEGPGAAPGSGPAWLSVLSVLVTAAVLASVGWALATGKPWEITGPWTWQRVAMGDTGFSVEIPSLVGPLEQVDREDAQEFLAGRVDRDPFLVDIVVIRSPGEAGSPEEEKRILEELQEKEVEGVPENATREGAARIRNLGGRDALERVFSFPNGLWLFQYDQVRGERHFKLGVLVWKEYLGMLPLRPESFVESLRKE